MDPQEMVMSHKVHMELGPQRWEAPAGLECKAQEQDPKLAVGSAL